MSTVFKSRPHWMKHADHGPIELLMLFGPPGERARLRARAETLQKVHPPNLGTE